MGEEPKLEKGVLWKREYPRCPLCHSEKRVSQVIREEMAAKDSELNQLAGGFIPYNVQQPCEIIPLEKMQLVIPSSKAGGDNPFDDGEDGGQGEEDSFFIDSIGISITWCVDPPELDTNGDCTIDLVDFATLAAE